MSEVNRIYFHHRSDLGITFGVAKREGVLYLSIAMANSGLSCIGNFRRERHDEFSRKTGRHIVTERLNAALCGKEPRFVTSFRADISALDFIKKFRAEFLPTGYRHDRLDYWSKALYVVNELIK